MRSNPFEEIEEMVDRLGREVESVGLLGHGSIPVDLVDRADEYVVRADLPGRTPGDIDLRIDDDTLTIEVADTTDQGERPEYLLRERREGAVERRLRFPEPVETDGVTASYDAGILSVTVPKEGGETATTIDIE